MNDGQPEHRIDPGAESWRELDDTLAEGPSPADLPDDARGWLCDQRVMHGLLRALHTADSAAREARIHRILDNMESDSAPSLRRWWLVTAAAALLACAGVWLALPAKLPTAEAAVGRAVVELARDVDRRFRVDLFASNGKNEVRTQLLLVTRPGKRFRADGRLKLGTFDLGEFRIGCDGEELWVLPANGSFRSAAPLAEHDRMIPGDLLDLGYLDVQDLVSKLPEDFDLAVVGRESDLDGRNLVRIEATRRAAPARVQMRSAWLLCDEATGMITRLEVETVVARGGLRRFSFEYLGEEAPGLVDYGRPW